MARVRVGARVRARARARVRVRVRVRYHLREPRQLMLVTLSSQGALRQALQLGLARGEGRG